MVNNRYGGGEVAEVPIPRAIRHNATETDITYRTESSGAGFTQHGEFIGVEYVDTATSSDITEVDQ